MVLVFSNTDLKTIKNNGIPRGNKKDISSVGVVSYVLSFLFRASHS
jgi:hypothetical protein